MRKSFLRVFAYLLLALNLAYALPAPGLVQHTDGGSYACRRSFGYGVYDSKAQQTVISWSGEKMSIYVRAFDHKSGQWSPKALIQKLNYTSLYDYHNYVTIAQAPDGHYLLFYFNHSKSAYLLKSPAPHVITGEWTHRKISDDFTAYPMPVVTDNAVYLFYSSTVAKWHRPYRMTASFDSGESWSAPITLITTGHKEPELYDEVYAHGYAVDAGEGDQADRILIGWEMAAGPNGHNQGSYGNYFAYYDCGDGQMYNAGGKALGSTIELNELFDDCMINNAKDPMTRIFGYTTFPEVLPDGRYAVVYNSRGQGSYIATWEDTHWDTKPLKIENGPKDYQRTPWGTYLIISGWGLNVDVWESTNGVTDWRKISTTLIPSNKGNDRINKAFIDNFHPQVLWQADSYRRELRQSDYSGSWPVFTYGNSSIGTLGSSE